MQEITEIEKSVGTESLIADDLTQVGKLARSCAKIGTSRKQPLYSLTKPCLAPFYYQAENRRVYLLNVRY